MTTRDRIEAKMLTIEQKLRALLAETQRMNSKLPDLPMREKAP